MHAAVQCPGIAPSCSCAVQTWLLHRKPCSMRCFDVPGGGQRQRQNKRKMDKETGKDLRRRAADEDADGLAGVLVGDASDDPLPV